MLRRPLLLLASVLAACARAPTSEPPEPAAGAIDLSEPPARRDPLAGLTPCPRDAQTACARPSFTEPGGPADPQPAPDVVISDTVWNVPVGPNDPTLGPAHALVTLVVFSDFQCPFCRHASATLRSIVARRSRNVRLVWKDFPLPMHEHAFDAAHFARTARHEKDDATFWAVHDRLFEEQEHLGTEAFAAIAREMHVDWDHVRRDLRDRRFGLILHEDIALGDALEVNQTPTTFVNGRRVVGAQPESVFDAVVNEELSKAKALVAEGVAPQDVYGRITSTGKQVTPVSDLPAP
jgi:protein-disulfide isomerase